MSNSTCSKCGGKMHDNGTHRCGCPEWNEGFAAGLEAGRAAALAEGVECWVVWWKGDTQDGVEENSDRSLLVFATEQHARVDFDGDDNYEVRPARLLIGDKP